MQLLPLIGGIVSGIGSLAASQAQASAAQAQADIYDTQAQMELERGRFEADRSTRQARRIVGQQVANYAASGIELAGSPAAVIDDTATEAALDIGAIRYGADARSGNLSARAELQRQSAKATSSTAILGFLTPVISGASNIN
jgi:hypothetical protein